LDVTDVESVKSAVEFVRESTGDELGVLVNNAGTGKAAPLLSPSMTKPFLTTSILNSKSHLADWLNSI
jgi:NAD(P)-dependent dehydrogenase (short-subunit alcohol dehydrogenase family)